MFSKIFKQMLRHKLITGIILLLIVAGGYFYYQRLTGEKNGVRYVTAAVEKGTLIVSVSGSGQVAVSDQVDVKPKVSGDVVYVGVETGQEVRLGTLIAQLDTRDAEKAVRDAEISLADAEIALKNIKGKATESLATAYDDGLNALTNTFKELLPIMPDLKKMFTKSSYSGDDNDIAYYLHMVRAYNNDSYQLSYWDGHAEEKYLVIEKEFDAVKADYFALNQNSSYDRIEITINRTYDMARIFLELVRQTYNLAQRYQTVIETENIIPPIPVETTDNHVSQLSEFTSLLINRVNTLSSVKQSLTDKKEAVTKEDLDIETQNLAVKQRQYALSDAKENLAQHYIRAPFDGLITKVSVKKGDSVSASTILINLITKQKIAEITLNEIDAANIKVDQKVTLTFDALPDVSIAGHVIEVDAMGTVTQGVVSYGVKIAFDADIETVKPGMSVTADIIIEAKQDVLVLPNSSVKSQGDSYYVELVEVSEEIKQQAVEIGLSNDLSTEIVSGLKEGDIVVTSTINPNAAQTTQTKTTQTQGFQIPGVTGGSGQK
jgi:HlyD family secretion protein